MPSVARRPYVVAGNYRQFLLYCREKGIGMDGATFVHDRYRIMGIPRDSEVIFTGTYQDRYDMDDIRTELRHRGIDWRVDPL